MTPVETPWTLLRRRDWRMKGWYDVRGEGSRISTYSEDMTYVELRCTIVVSKPCS